MSRDPYIDAKGEVEANIQRVGDLLSSYNRVNTADASTVAETIEELETTLGLLETDLEDLEECVRVIEEHGDRWGIGEPEVRERRSFVSRIARDVQSLQVKVRNVVSKAKRKGPERYRDDVERQANEDTDEAARWEMEEQQLLMRRQDSTLGVISGTLTNLASQAGLIGQEVEEHGVMLEDLDTRLDTTQSRLSRVSRTMKDFIQKNEDTRSSWCIAILIIILIILLVLVILV